MKRDEVCPMKRANENRWFRSWLVLLCVAVATLLQTIIPQDGVFADDNELAAVFRNGSLEVNIPYDEAFPRNRSLTLEVIDPSDKPIAKAIKSAGTDGRAVRVSLPIEKRIPLEDLAWDRLRISAGDSVKTVSISEILRVPVVRIMAQRAYAAGSTASIRVITTD